MDRKPRGILVFVYLDEDGKVIHTITESLHEFNLEFSNDPKPSPPVDGWEVWEPGNLRVRLDGTRFVDGAGQT